VNGTNHSGYIFYPMFVYIVSLQSRLPSHNFRQWDCETADS